MANKLPELRVAELDFNTIKTNLKTYLKNQDEFSDYDFEGAALNVIMDLLSYNTHYMGVYANMAANERFLDTAQKRASIVSIAKELAYTPHSITASSAHIKITLNTNGSSPNPRPAFETLNRGATFDTVVNGVPYTFTTNEDVQAQYDAVNDQYVFDDVTIYEGVARSFQFRYSDSLETRFIIPDKNIDTSTLLVTVRDDISSTDLVTYNLMRDLLTVDAESEVYFLHENEQQRYELKFGDGFVGLKPSDGNVIRASYIITNGPGANKASGFTFASNEFSDYDVTLETLSEGAGGQNRETAEEVRFRAPIWYQTQNRAVTSKDYEIFILHNFPQIQGVQVWGGEDNDPPFWGKVFIALDPETGVSLTNTVKTDILNLVKQYAVMAITPELADTYDTKLILTVAGNYNVNKTIKTGSTIRSDFIDVVEAYNEDTLKTFGKVFRISELEERLMDSDSSILSAKVSLKFEHDLDGVDLTKAENYVINYNNPIVPGSIISENFVLGTTSGLTSPAQEDYQYFIDDGAGNIDIVENRAGSAAKVLSGGTVNYTTGRIALSEFFITEFKDSSTNVLTVSATPSDENIYSKREQILRIDLDQLSVSVTPELV